ncbi:DUF4126 domain-containing protein [Marihabitans asiaticum]|uniref:Uncharacterized protein DUF4126 n=1 Tax=Marihabitans asiaticum TaxID=415218 RepID=A0A560WD97_9MICO|nr:DUF4126 domain-containing protein [Marihabitans asiaticum]TWD15627.1 uncharacterized protein DUF4126 [Marihabitans asiaticum]
MLAALTGMGLSAAAGLNAYVPFLIMALLARFTDIVTLPSAYAWMESWWAIGIGAVLLLTEVTLDKVPAVDSLNDAIQTFIRPAMGGLMGAAAVGAERIEESSWMQQNPWLGVVLGVVVAGLVHGGKAASRPVINAGSAGVGAPVVSTMEDGASIGISLVAIFLPILVVLVLIALAALLIWVWRAWVRMRRRPTRASVVRPS